MRIDTCDQTICIRAAVENIAAVNQFLDTILAGVSCSARARMQLDLAVEEIFVNIATYAYDGGMGDVTLTGGASAAPPAVRLSFSDAGTPYNPLERADPDIGCPLEERAVGKLGIFLVKKSVDEVHYEYRDGKNVLTIYKKLD
jgi:anti-sigma regulatory factor